MRMTIELEDAEMKALQEMAWRECRWPKQQIRILVREAAAIRGIEIKTPMSNVVMHDRPQNDHQD